MNCLNDFISLFQAKGFSDKMDTILQRLGQIEGMLITSRPVGGLPETAKDQLERFLVCRRSLEWKVAMSTVIC